MFDRIALKIEIKYSVLILGVLSTIAACAISFELLQNSSIDIGQKIQALSVVFAAGIGLTTLIYTAINVHSINNSTQVDTQFKKLEHSSYFIRQMYSGDMIRAGLLLRDFKEKLHAADMNSDKEKIRNELKTNSKAKLALISRLNFLEHMCQEIESGIADEEYLRDFFKIILIDNYHMFLWYIVEAQQEDKTNITFCHMKNIAEKWSSNENA